jgi:hypothetical protein
VKFRRVVFSALLIGTLLGNSLAIQAAAAPPTTSSTSVPTLQNLLSQKGIDLSALTNMLQQFELGADPSATDTPWYSTLLNGILGTILGPAPTGASLTNTLLEKAAPNACFGVISRDPNHTSHVTEVYDQPKVEACPNKATAGTEKNTVPKTDQSYVWGLTQVGNYLWFGTVANTQCQVEGTYLQRASDYASVNSVSTCEYGAAGNPSASLGGLGDWRPPHIYIDDPQTPGLAGLTDAETLPAVGGHNLTDDLKQTLGLRSAGSVGDYVVLAGPGVVGGGVNVYIFTASNRTYQGMIHFSQYDNIRKWLTYNGVLYTAMHNAPPALGGSVLKWTPNPNNLLDPNAFTVVGHVNGDPAELVAFENRIFINTWPDPTALMQMATSLSGASVTALGNSNPSLLPVAGLWMSPTFSGSLNASTATWSEPWNVLDYEPDPVTALTYGSGALAVYNGQLYWGTMHVPLFSSLVHYALYGAGIASDTATNTTMIYNSERSIAIFRGANFGQSALSVFFGRAPQSIQLLYGETSLPVWIPNSLTDIQGPGRWVNMLTKAGMPRFGHSGFGNEYNNYTWSMTVYKGSLYIGTMDWSILGGGPSSSYGADLWRFNAPYQPAEAVDTTGVGNPLNYGIRNMITSNDGNAMYLGMANPMNLSSLGGWELRVLK